MPPNWVAGGEERSGNPGLAVRSGNGLRFRRPALAQENGQHHDRKDRQELALPVLERLEPEFTGTEELQRRDGMTSMRELLLAVLPGAADRMQTEREEEEEHE